MANLRSQITAILTEDMHHIPDGYLIHGAIDKLVGLIESEAVGFAEWILKNGIESTCRNTWVDFRVNPSIYYTTAELYKKYKEESK